MCLIFCSNKLIYENLDLRFFYIINFGRWDLDSKFELGV